MDHMIRKSLWLLVLWLAGCNLALAEPTAIPTPALPTVEFLYPLNNAQVYEGTDLTFDILARDEILGVERIELYLNGELLNQAVLQNYTYLKVFRVEMNWVTNGIGRHAISAIAYRPTGAASAETYLTIEVIPN